MKKLKKLIDRLEKLNIKTTYLGNYPWIYLDTVNDKKVSEKFQGNHGFTVAFQSIKREGQINFTDIKEIFKIIRKYK